MFGVMELMDSDGHVLIAMSVFVGLHFDELCYPDNLCLYVFGHHLTF